MSEVVWNEYGAAIHVGCGHFVWDHGFPEGCRQYVSLEKQCGCGWKP